MFLYTYLNPSFDNGDPVVHTVRDVFCATCSSLLGWKYDFAYEQSQKYKEGKFIVEKAMVLHEGGW